ncbi:MAG: hypothetical protein QOE70_4292 [Chthoniobacter sp.]|jgi:hypothetical protein|nr:hypothetical protein [Chthoniobacter sp.]
MKELALPGLDTAWLEGLNESLDGFLTRLRSDGQPGRYLPCQRGVTAVGREMGLGFSCFALKLQHMLGHWDTLPAAERAGWVEFIQSFQCDKHDGAFVDPPEMNYLTHGRTWRDRLWSVLGRGKPKDFARSILLAETKQAIATLAEVGAPARIPFRDFALTPEGVRAFFESKDWSRPWGAGGQSAGLVVFIKTQGPALLPARDVEELLDVCRDFYAGLADPESGAYFRTRRPAHGELINGAMKVLMALEWLEVPPHYAERLIQTCIAHPPSSDGCHLVDAIYVLHQSLRGEASATVRAYCAHVLELIRRHAHADGGFSFFVGKAQNRYYGVPISRGLDEGDLQGTCLLVWAIAMIWKMLAPESARWKTIRP